jgi:small subunit ribosomal protein S17
MKSGSKIMTRRLKGIVISNKMARTVVVRIDRLTKHLKYLKYYKTSRKFKADDPKSEYRVGDEVMIEETRPISKDKRWRVAKLIKRKEIEEMAEG